MTTTVYDTKRALFDLLDGYTAVGQPLEGIRVSYAYPGDPGMECIYGGGVRFTHTDAAAAPTGVLVREEAFLSVYIRVVLSPAGDVADADARAAVIGGWLGAILRANPTLAGGSTWLGISAGQGDYEQTGDETISVLAYQVRTARNIAYGGG